MPLCADCIRPEGFCNYPESRQSKTSGCSSGLRQQELNQEINSEVCSWCKGACCSNIDMTGWIPSKLLSEFPLAKATDKCPALSDNGCVLPREIRSTTCLLYQCGLISHLKTHREDWQYCQVYGKNQKTQSCRVIIFCNNCPNWERCKNKYKQKSSL